MRYYIIRHKETGKYLPHPERKRNKTSAELSDTQPPRLFTTKRAATNALRWWIEGVSFRLLFYPPELGDLHLERREERKREEMEIIEVELRFLKEERRYDVPHSKR